MATQCVIAFQKHPDHEYSELISVNGRLDANSLVVKYPRGRMAQIQNQQVADALWNERFEDLQKAFTSIDLPIPGARHEFVTRVVLTFVGSVAPVLGFPISMNLPEWAKPWSARAFLNALADLVGEQPDSQPTLERSAVKFDGTCTITFPISTSGCTIRQVVETHLPQTVFLVDAAERRLQARLSSDALITYFQFPEEVSAAAQQYLLYFIQFLSDLGIDATAELKQQAGKVLFSVMPDSGAEALERVRDALRLYLNLPTTPEFIPASEPFSDLAVFQLRANVLHLQSQLTLALATLQTKEATIESLQITNFQYRQYLVGSQSAGSERTQDMSTTTSSAKEPVLGDAVAVTKYVGKGFEIDLPAIVRALKRKFRPTRQ